MPSRAKIASLVTVLALGALAAAAFASAGGSDPAAVQTRDDQPQARTEVVRETVHHRARSSSDDAARSHRRGREARSDRRAGDGRAHDAFDDHGADDGPAHDAFDDHGGNSGRGGGDDSSGHGGGNSGRGGGDD